MKKIGILMFSLSTFLLNGMAKSETDKFSPIFQRLEEVTKIRESLSATLIGRKEPITVEDFKRVCAPAGEELKRWSVERGFKARQVSEKFRNPQHRPNEMEQEVLARFSKDRSLRRLDLPSRDPKNPGHFVFAPIEVAASCLTCHGAKEARPKFVVEKYPADLAHGFKSGDLRGMYSVFVPL
jgi:predicted Zn-ribbon and HTH transcriptional regulator